MKLHTSSRKVIHICDLDERREKARRDMVAEKKMGDKQAIFEIAQKLLGINMPIEQIVAVTGLTSDEVNSLHLKKTQA